MPQTAPAGLIKKNGGGNEACKREREPLGRRPVFRETNFNEVALSALTPPDYLLFPIAAPTAIIPVFVTQRRLPAPSAPQSDGRGIGVQQWR